MLFLTVGILAHLCATSAAAEPGSPDQAGQEVYVSKPRPSVPEHDVRVSVTAIDLRSQVSFEANPDQLHTLASVAKVYILVAFLDVAQGDDREISLEEGVLMQDMIEKSDNEAASELYRLIGERDGLLEYLARDDLPAVEIPRNASWGDIRASSKDVAVLLLRLYQGSLLDEKHTNVALRHLSNVIESQAWGVGVAREDDTEPENGDPATPAPEEADDAPSEPAPGSPGATPESLTETPDPGNEEAEATPESQEAPHQTPRAEFPAPEALTGTPESPETAEAAETAAALSSMPASASGQPSAAIETPGLIAEAPTPVTATPSQSPAGPQLVRPEDQPDRVYFKNGWYPKDNGWIVNSAGIVVGSGGEYVVVLLTDAHPSLEEGQRYVSEVFHLLRFWQIIFR